jgi:hypothetical protein
MAFQFFVRIRTYSVSFVNSVVETSRARSATSSGYGRSPHRHRAHGDSQRLLLFYLPTRYREEANNYIQEPDALILGSDNLMCPIPHCSKAFWH